MVRTDPHDVARVESKTFICTEVKHESVPRAKEECKASWVNVVVSLT